MTLALSKFIKLVNLIYIKAFSLTTWYKHVITSQEIILNLNPHPAYTLRYNNEEFFYWLFIPKWLYDDSKQLKRLKCLDIGAAYGTLALFSKLSLNDCEVYCIDFTNEYISDSLTNRYNINFSVTNIELDILPWESKFDVIIFTEVLEHLNFHPVSTLKKIRGLLNNNGVLYLSTPDASQWGRVTKYYSNLSDIPPPTPGTPAIDDHVWVYNKQELLSVVEAAGFKIRHFAYSPGTLGRHFNLALVKD